MSVPVSRRNLSELEFYHTATVLRLRLTEWLLRDFGIKDKVRNASIIAKSAKMTKEDKELFISLLEKYGLEKQLTEDYPTWWINERRHTVDSICANLLQNIRMANAIYPTNEVEYADRRLHQDHAIGNAYQLLEELQYIVLVLNSTLGVDMNKYIPYTDLIETEITLLRAWRKSDRRFLSNIRKENS